MRKRLKTILCLVLSLTATVGLVLVRDSAAWFNTQTGSSVKQDITVQKLKFTFSGELRSFLQYTDANHTPFIITDQNLVRSSAAGAEDSSQTVALSGVNTSTVATEVRFKVFYTSPNGGTLSTYTGGAGDLLQVEAASGWSGPDANGYFTRSFAANTGTNSTSFDLLYSLYFSDSALEDAGVHDFADLSTGRIVIAMQARQSDYMLWSDLGEITSSSTYVASAMTATNPS